MKYTIKEQEVEAMQWTGKENEDLDINYFIRGMTTPLDDGRLLVPTRSGDLYVELQEWIVKLSSGGTLIEKHDKFYENYQKQ